MKNREINSGIESGKKESDSENNTNLDLIWAIIRDVYGGHIGLEVYVGGFKRDGSISPPSTPSPAS